MTTIIVETLTGSTYTLRRAADVKGAPTTLRHSKGAYVPPEVLLNHGQVITLDGADVEIAEHFFGGTIGSAVTLKVGGDLRLRTSPIVRLTVDGIDIPVGVTRMGDV